MKPSADVMPAFTRASLSDAKVSGPLAPAARGADSPEQRHDEYRQQRMVPDAHHHQPTAPAPLSPAGYVRSH
jgi:hypothetical protein